MTVKMPLAFGGHCYYVTKLTTGEPIKGESQDFWRRQIGGVELPETAVDKSVFVEVTHVGPQVGKPCSKLHMDRFKRVKCLNDIARVGDVLLCPNENPGIKRSPLDKTEFFIEESVPLAIVTGAEAGSGE